MKYCTKCETDKSPDEFWKLAEAVELIRQQAAAAQAANALSNLGGF